MSGRPPSTLGKYEIHGTVGKGAMGIVYDGFDPMIRRRVAIKTLRLPDTSDPEMVEGLERFRREARAAGRLSHPNIVGVFDYGETDEIAYIVMEFVEGRSLKDWLADNAPTSAADAAALLADVLTGLAYSHDNGVVHRDIKPANIMITADRSAKIADFGIARIETVSSTQIGTIMGTPAYMSPEQFMGEAVDRRTDIYSCGVMLYQLLTGKRPFDGSQSAIMHKVLTTDPPRPSEIAGTVPPAFDRVVARAMARRPEDRFASAAAFLQALRTPQAASDDTIVIAADQRPGRSRASMAPAAQTSGVTKPMTVRAEKPGSNYLIPRLAIILGVCLASSGLTAWALLPGGLPVELPALASALQPEAPTEADRGSVPQNGSPTPSVTAPGVATAGGGAPGEITPGGITPSGAAPAGIPPAPAPFAVLTSPAQPEPTPAPPPAAENPPPELPATPSPSDLAATPAGRQAELEAAVTDRLQAAACFFGGAATGADGSLMVTGLVGAGAPDASLRDTVAAATPAPIAWRIGSFDGPYCPTLDLLRPLGTDRGMTARQTGGVASLREGELVRLQVIMADFAGFLHIADLHRDGTVTPLLPGRGSASLAVAARSEVRLGALRADFAGWRVEPPFGTDLIIVVAGSQPLFERPLPAHQPVAEYLASLRQAIAALQQRGGRMAAAVMLLETRPADQSSPRPAARSAPKPRSARCNDILDRAQLGELPTDGDRAFLRTECR